MRSEKEILAEIEEASAKIKALSFELDSVRRIKRTSSSNSYEKRKAILENAAPVFASILKPGDYVKVTGTRSSPYREIKEINKYELIGATCTFNKRTGNIAKVNAYDIITCGTNKIIAVLRNGKWVTAKEILAETVDIRLESV
jgi:hypothetical protein